MHLLQNNGFMPIWGLWESGDLAEISGNSARGGSWGLAGSIGMESKAQSLPDPNREIFCGWGSAVSGNQWATGAKPTPFDYHCVGQVFGIANEGATFSERLYSYCH